MGEPYFVVRIDPVTHDVVIGQRDELARRLSRGQSHELAVETAPRTVSLPGENPLQYPSSPCFRSRPGG